MAVTRSNVLVGMGTFSISGTDVGSTLGGVAIEKAVDYFEKKVDQVLDAIALTPITNKMTVKTNIAESTLENLKIVWNESTSISSTAGGRVLTGGITTAVTERALSFNGKSPEGFNRTYTFHKVVAVGASAHSIKKDDVVQFPVEFRVLPDLTKSAGAEYYTVQDFPS